MLEHFDDKFKTKIMLVIIVMTVFSFLYTTLDREDTGCENDLGTAFIRSLAVQTYRFDVFTQKNLAFAMVMCQSVLAYIIILF